jgi:hypothetical protein
MNGFTKNNFINLQQAFDFFFNRERSLRPLILLAAASGHRAGPEALRTALIAGTARSLGSWSG